MKKSEEEMLRAFVEWGKNAPAEEIIAALEETNFLDFRGEQFNMPKHEVLATPREEDTFVVPLTYFATSKRIDDLQPANDYSYAMAA